MSLTPLVLLKEARRNELFVQYYALLQMYAYEPIQIVNHPYRPYLDIQSTYIQAALAAL